MAEFSLQRKIFLDRYALKEVNATSATRGDLVLYKPTGRDKPYVVEVVDSFNDGVVILDPKFNRKVGLDFGTFDRLKETSVEEMWRRIAKTVATDFSEETAYYNILSNFKFVPAGRILAGCGSGEVLTYYNCFVLPSPQDSRHGILETLDLMTETMSRGGGVGINIGTLRPKNAKVQGVNGRSSGSVSWGGLYSYVCGLIEQGGSRRGALMLMLPIWHPDVVDFIKEKRDETKLVNANISVAITDEFMRAVEEGGEWTLQFPDTSFSKYNKEWNGDLDEWLAKGYPVIDYEYLDAKQLWSELVTSAWKCAEPGVWFISRAQKRSNSFYYTKGKIICTNPCAEEPLPAYGVCNLGHINLSLFYDSEINSVAWKALAETITTAVAFLDRVIDLSPSFCEEIRKQQQKERRIGLGTLGLAELLIRCNIRYGSPECLHFVDQLYSFIANEAYKASARLANVKGSVVSNISGSFPAYDEKILESEFIRQLQPETIEKIQRLGLRNVTLLTQAPTGAVGTMVGTSTGIEPFYAWSYSRSSRLGKYNERVGVLDEWLVENNLVEEFEKHGEKILPHYFVTAMQLTPEEHVGVQATVQKWTDASVSKTINCPESWTVSDVDKLYRLLYSSGCLGGTVYRDKSRKSQVLEGTPPKTEKVSNTQSSLGEEPKVRPIPDRRRGDTISKQTPFGTAHITMNVDDKGHPFEVFVDIGKGGSDIKAVAEALGRLVSVILRMLSPLSPEDRVKVIIDQLSNIGSLSSYGIGPIRVRSLPDSLAMALKDWGTLLNYEDISKEDKTKPAITHQIQNIAGDFCPACGYSGWIREEGCFHCVYCGHSACN